MTGMEVADRKSVMRFLLTISVSALPGSRREEERDSTLLYNSYISGNKVWKEECIFVLSTWLPTS